MVVNLWKYRLLILRNALNDLRYRYTGSVGGYLWNILIPLAQITVFGTVFSALMPARFPEGHPLHDSTFGFIIFMCSSLLPWNAFGDTLARGVASLVANSGYLKTLRIPEQIFVATDAGAGFFSALLAMAVFLVVCVLVGNHGPFLAWLQVVPLLALFLGFAFGLGLCLSCINVFYRDLQPLINIILLLWFWVTPIVYQVQTVINSFPWAKWLYPLNPAYHFVRAFQLSVTDGQWLGPERWTICTAITLGANALAYFVLRRLRPEIRDVL